MERHGDTDPKRLAGRAPELPWQQRLGLRLLKAEVAKALAESPGGAKIEKIE